MQPIDLSKLSAEINTTESDKNRDISSKDINSQLTSAIAEKQHLAIALLLKQTLQHLSKDGLLSVDIQKAVLNVKNILPGEFTQLFIQDRVQQQKIAETLANLQLKPAQLTNGTVNQWFSGQLIQSIVYQSTQSEVASLLVSKSGQFPPALLSQLGLSALNEKLISNELIKNSQIVQIKTQVELQVGQQLLLQVNKSSSEISLAIKHAPVESHLISQYINQRVTKQQALPQLIATLREISTQTNQANTFFTPQFKTQVEAVLQQFPPLSTLSTETAVKNAVQNSGLYLESKILNNPPNAQISMTDLKAGLSKLVTLINNNEAILLPKISTFESSFYKTVASESFLKSGINPPAFFDLPNNVSHAQVQKPILDLSLFQLNNHLLLQTKILDQLDGVLSRIVINQLQTRESSEQSFLNVEIPFRHNDQQEVLQLKIREELKNKAADQGDRIWTVNLAFNLDALGGIRIYITLDKKELAIQFWTENKASQQLFQKYFNLLSERLIDADFTISQLSAFHGMPEEAHKELQASHFIIDEKV